MDIIKISLLGVCGVILGFLMKGTKPEYACFITVGIGLVIMGLAVGKMFESLGKIQETLPVDTEYISTLVKMIGITYIGQFASGICKDAGYSTTAAQIELFCKLSVMVLSMPVLMALLKTIQEFMEGLEKKTKMAGNCCIVVCSMDSDGNQKNKCKRREHGSREFYR